MKPLKYCLYFALICLLGLLRFIAAHAPQSRVAAMFRAIDQSNLLTVLFVLLGTLLILSIEFLWKVWGHKRSERLIKLHTRN